jgi:hypothetical protein
MLLSMPNARSALHFDSAGSAFTVVLDWACAVEAAATTVVSVAAAATCFHALFISTLLC